MYQVYSTTCQVSFHLWRNGPVLKHCKIPKFFDEDCLKILSVLPMMIQVFRKSAHFGLKK